MNVWNRNSNKPEKNKENYKSYLKRTAKQNWNKIRKQPKQNTNLPDVKQDPFADPKVDITTAMIIIIWPVSPMRRSPANYGHTHKIQTLYMGQVVYVYMGSTVHGPYMVLESCGSQLVSDYGGKRYIMIIKWRKIRFEI